MNFGKKFPMGVENKPVKDDKLEILTNKQEKIWRVKLKKLDFKNRTSLDNLVLSINHIQ